MNRGGPFVKSAMVHRQAKHSYQLSKPLPPRKAYLMTCPTCGRPLPFATRNRLCRLCLIKLNSYLRVMARYRKTKAYEASKRAP